MFIFLHVQLEVYADMFRMLPMLLEFAGPSIYAKWFCPTANGQYTWNCSCN